MGVLIAMPRRAGKMKMYDELAACDYDELIAAFKAVGKVTAALQQLTYSFAEDEVNHVRSVEVGRIIASQRRRRRR